MVLVHVLEHSSSPYVLLCAFVSLAASVYGFLRRARPFGLVEISWAWIILRCWQLRLAGLHFAEATVARLGT